MSHLWCLCIKTKQVLVFVIAKCQWRLFAKCKTGCFLNLHVVLLYRTMVLRRIISACCVVVWCNFIYLSVCNLPAGSAWLRVFIFDDRGTAFERIFKNSVTQDWRPQAARFFRFYMLIFRKVAVLDLGVGRARLPPLRNPGSATAQINNETTGTCMVT